ncbi:hypothetical protein B4102_3279 [Heyndrickxia sporothermodurans]|uniref:Uncharacterized protein n=1 Tax=Heyndrickxia sporothermodurans TaxID=46224 RepID=A0A150KWI3_9BACI|nr:hypothetical protein [Heyndrickxia sporothermodurans]KYD04433.1 hypothetical protein B4102_3279 [Heyndrickxia sporothermodurans]
MGGKNYQIVNLEELVNNQGFSSIDEYENGELTYGGSSLPAENIKFNEDFNINSIPFKIIRNSKIKDNIEVEGQTVTFPTTSIKRIHFLSLSVYGSYFQEVKLFNDKMFLESKPFYTTDLAMNAPEFEGVIEGLKFDYLHNKKGKVPFLNGTIWYSNIDLTSPKPINTIQFEDNPAIHVFSITLEEEEK